VVSISPSLSVQPARPEDFERIAQLTVDVYVGGGLASPGYSAELADVARRATRSELLVVRDEGDRVVDPAAQGRGIGALLDTTCLERARAAGKRRMVISTGQEMTAAHRLYERLGFERLPERDWTPEPGVDLLVYALDLGKRTALPPTARRLAGDPAAGPSDGVDGGDQVALLEDLALHHVQLLHDAGPLGEHGDLHLHRLQDDQRVPCGHRRPGLHEDLPDAGDHLRVDLLDRHRASS
jgi:GNAT superfamily N-acetyltransferase